MIITEEGIKRIRELLNEEIPEGGADADTLFSDLNLSITMQGSESENHALYLLWTQKAGRIQKTAGDIKSIHAGGESVEHYTLVIMSISVLKPRTATVRRGKMRKKRKNQLHSCCYGNRKKGVTYGRQY